MRKWGEQLARSRSNEKQINRARKIQRVDKYLGKSNWQSSPRPRWLNARKLPTELRGESFNDWNDISLEVGAWSPGSPRMDQIMADTQARPVSTEFVSGWGKSHSRITPRNLGFFLTHLSSTFFLLSSTLFFPALPSLFFLSTVSRICSILLATDSLSLSLSLSRLSETWLQPLRREERGPVRITSVKRVHG